MLDLMGRSSRWRVAVTHDDIDRSVYAALERAGFVAVSCPVMVEAAAPDRQRLEDAARKLQGYDMVICSSVRSVRALIAARGSKWPSGPRVAAVGSVTAAALIDAGAVDPLVADTFTAKALWEKLQTLGSWRGMDVLVATVEGGRRDLIDGLLAVGAKVTELEAYRMLPRSAGDIRKEWKAARPDALILGSSATAITLIDAVGVAAIRALRVVVPIGPTTAAALAERGIIAAPPREATYPAVIAQLRCAASAFRACRDGARAKVDPSEAG
jgi:uroporphyrinogen-III synthase